MRSEHYTYNERFTVGSAKALETVAQPDRIILDTGDGAAIAFVSDPEDALFAALKIRHGAGEIRVRMGINRGPVRLVRDLNRQINMIGDGINVANRIMSFCDPGELLVSRAFYEVVSCLSDGHVNSFTPMGSRTDKHSREHEIYSIGAQLHVADFAADRSHVATGSGTILGAQSPESRQRGGGSQDRAARVFDAGESLIVFRTSRDGVEAALRELVGQVARLISPVTAVNNRWMATCGHPSPPGSAVRVTEFGLRRIITGETQEAVSKKVAELLSHGAVLVNDVEYARGVWLAVCETGSTRD